MSDDRPPDRRRDFLFTVAMATAGLGATVALWPFIAAMGPADDTRAPRVVFDLTKLDGTTHVIVPFRNAPIFVFRRTARQLTRLQDPASPYTPRDRESAHSEQPPKARNWHRSLRPELMVMNACCTKEGCIVSRQSDALGVEIDFFRCPCCGSNYDLAGRVLSGPARSNLVVPPYRYIGETEIELGDDAHPSFAEHLMPWRANPRSRYRT